MDAQAWDERYAAEPEMWGPANATVVEAVERLSPGTAVDLGCGDGRHAAWLSQHGWRVQAVDFSEVAVAQARARPDADHARIEWLVGDAETWQPHAPVDLVLVAYLHLPRLTTVLRTARTWLAAHGALFYLGHARENLDHGVGGPPDPDVLPTAEQLAAALDGSRVRRLAHVDRETADGTAVDIVAMASPWPSAPVGRR